MTNNQNSDNTTLSRAETIARLNDHLRMTGQGGTIVLTRTVRHLPGLNAPELTDALANFEGFDKNNNPHGERDMGCFKLFGAELYFKIDYFDTELKFGSEDPADASITHRVLTILAKEDF